MFGRLGCLFRRGRCGSGYFLQTVSAAGLPNQVGSAVYVTAKRAAIGLADHLTITDRDDGIRVSVLCPRSVDMAILQSLERGPQFRDGACPTEMLPMGRRRVFVKNDSSSCRIPRSNRTCGARQRTTTGGSAHGQASEEIRLQGSHVADPASGRQKTSMLCLTVAMAHRLFES